MGLKVAILGLAQSSRHLAPWGKEDWELWGLAWDTERYRYARVFEPHDLEDLKSRPSPVGPYLEKINECARLYMVEAYPDVPLAERYPIEDVASMARDYFESTIAYMVALAIHEGAEEIALYGVDMRHEQEYHYQRPNLEYWLGFAEGRGIKVHVPDTSPVLKYTGAFGYSKRYGCKA